MRGWCLQVVLTIVNQVHRCCRKGWNREAGGMERRLAGVRLPALAKAMGKCGAEAGAYGGCVRDAAGAIAPGACAAQFEKLVSCLVKNAKK